MKKTHFERIMESSAAPYCVDLFKKCVPFDDGKNIVREEDIAQVCDPEYYAYMRGNNDIPVPERSSKKLNISIIHHLYHCWKDRNYFDFTLPLFNKLRDTTLKDIDCYFLQFPYRSMYMSMPKGNGMHLAHYKTGEPVEVSAIYLLNVDIGINQELYIRQKSEIITGVQKIVYIMAHAQDPKDIDDISNDTINYFQLMFWDGKLSKSIEKSKELIKFYDDTWDTMKEIFHSVVKSILYVTCSNAVLKKIPGFNLELKISKFKNERAKRRFKQRYKHSLVPHQLADIVVDRTAPERSYTRTGLFLPKRGLELVKGHFKDQPYGPELKLRKAIYIEPYVRGEGSEFYRKEKRYVIK